MLYLWSCSRCCPAWSRVSWVLLTFNTCWGLKPLGSKRPAVVLLMAQYCNFNNCSNWHFLSVGHSQFAAQRTCVWPSYRRRSFVRNTALSTAVHRWYGKILQWLIIILLAFLTSPITWGHNVLEWVGMLSGGNQTLFFFSMGRSKVHLDEHVKRCFSVLLLVFMPPTGQSVDDETQLLTVGCHSYLHLQKESRRNLWILQIYRLLHSFLLLLGWEQSV